MKFGLSTIAYHESRFIEPFLKHIPEWVEDRIVLNSTTPWMGEPEEVRDETAKLAKLTGARVIRNRWTTEQDQRNSGQFFHEDKDWVIVMDPDEFLSNEDWKKLKGFLETTDADAVVVEGQYTYWKDGWVADPPKDYQMLIAVRPQVKFVDKRVVGTNYVVAPIWLHHFSWARTDEEVWRKISHYAHAKDFDTNRWFNEVWKKWKPGMQDVHPTTPETLHDFKKAQLPPELERLGLFP